MGPRSRPSLTSCVTFGNHSDAMLQAVDTARSSCASMHLMLTSLELRLHERRSSTYIQPRLAWRTRRVDATRLTDVVGTLNWRLRELGHPPTYLARPALPEHMRLSVTYHARAIICPRSLSPSLSLCASERFRVAMPLQTFRCLLRCCGTPAVECALGRMVFTVS